MTANELADALEEWVSPRTVEQAATMLRQQQAEIERLIGSKPITYGMLTFCKNCGEQNPYQSEILKNGQNIDQMISPVAWISVEPVAMRYDFDGYGYMYIDSGSGSDWQTREKGEFLYIHPIRELTDEEIESEWFKVFKPETGIGKNITNGIYDFARAILKRASDK